MAVDGRLNFDTKIDTKGFNAGTKQLSSGLGSLKSMLGKVAVAAAAAFSVKKMIDFGKEAISTASDLQEVQNVVDTAFGSMSDKMEQFAKTSITQFGISRLAAKQTGSTFMAMASGMGIAQDSASDMAVALTGLSADMASFYNVEQDVSSTALKSIFTGETETLKKFGVVMTEANLEAFALSQGITKSLSAMTQAEKVQLRYNYVMAQTSLAHGDFAKTQDSWANQTRILSEQWKEFSGTVGQALMGVLLPAVKVLNKAFSSLISYAQRAVKALSEVFGIDIGTSDTTAGIVDSTAEIADNYSDMAESAEEAKKANEKQLAGFDKITKLEDNDDAKVSTGVTGGLLAGQGVLTAKIDVDTSSAEKKVSESLERIKKLFTSGNWEGIGALLAEKINSLFGRINWQAIQTFVKEQVQKVTDFLNGLVRNINWELLGKEIGEGFNTVLVALYTFITTFDFVSFGMSLARLLNGIIDSVDWSMIGGYFAQKINALIGTIYGFVTTFDWSGFGNSIATAVNSWFDSIDWEQLGKTITESINGLFSTVLEFLHTIEWFKIGQKIGVFLCNIDWWGIATNFFKVVKEAFKSAFQTFWGLVTPIADKIQKWFEDLSPAMQKVVTAIGAICTAFLVYKTVLWVVTAIQAVFAAVTTVSTGGINMLALAITVLIGLYAALWAVFHQDEINAFAAKLRNIADLYSQVKNKVGEDVNNIDASQNKNTIDTSSIFDPAVAAVLKDSFPAFATGTVVPANYGEFLAILGDNKRETEVVSPLSTIEQAVTNAMSRNGEIGNGNLTAQIQIDIDGRKLHTEMVRLNNARIRQTGNNPLVPVT
ncbi:MAG: hypothetical protein Q4D35_03030 [Ruminococcus sp.]|nr:hypothetical protein [Ruminococcus sp.]